MIQLYVSKKNFDTQKAERFFKERGIKFQSVDLKEKGLSKGELQSVIQAAGGLDAVIDPDCKDKDLLALLAHLVPEDRFEKVLDNQQLLRQPIVRNGKKAAVGYQPEAWKKMAEG
ncbi:MAG: ArsC family transcriptional regulator [Lachnospiraceae bacterium]|nr:ArsC family transcriptional regulator [Lachnospiraceae bacterium]